MAGINADKTCAEAVTKIKNHTEVGTVVGAGAGT